MKNYILYSLLLIAAAFGSLAAQAPLQTTIEILKAEDELRFDAVLENLMKSADPKARLRAALAAGRIGKDAAVPALVRMLQNEPSARGRDIAAFALGEIESIKAADAILQAIGETGKPDLPGITPSERGRLAEAAGKIAAANPKHPKAKELGNAIIFTLAAEHFKGGRAHKETVLLALTAALRAKPEGADAAVAKFLTHSDARIRADAANALARLRAKNANEALRAILKADTDPISRANAARALGAAEDKGALDILIKAAVEDGDSRVRVSAIRALGSLKDAKAADKLLERGGKLLADYKKSKFTNPVEKNELLEICTAIGRINLNSKDSKSVEFLKSVLRIENKSPEVNIALARVDSDGYHFNKASALYLNSKESNWATLASDFQAMSELTKANQTIIDVSKMTLHAHVIEDVEVDGKRILEFDLTKALPDAIRSYSAFKPDDLVVTLIGRLSHPDIFIRVVSAELLAEQPASKVNVEALKAAFNKSLQTDKEYNDAQLAILDALFKLNKKEAVGSLIVSLSAPDYLVRKKAFELLSDESLQKEFPELAATLESDRKIRKKDQVLPFKSSTGTKLGQILNTEADYRRAASRKNGTVKAVVTTEKGAFTIDFYPEDAPLTVDNFIKLARAKYFDGVEVHRVVPNFVMQDGDPLGSGNGGPGWSIRCEINMLPYDRGMVGMALSGKDTGGSQWFVTHSPQPHLDGGYTVFGSVNAGGMKIVDTIVRGDKILSVKIIEGSSPQRHRGTEKKKKIK